MSDDPIDQTIYQLLNLADRTSHGVLQPEGARYVVVQPAEYDALRAAISHLRTYQSRLAAFS